jgi:bifunctional non-homologous end joining protein LigD
MLRSLTRTAENFAVTEWVEKDGIALFEAARTLCLPGIYARITSSKYLDGRASDDWLAIRLARKAEFVIGGYTYTPRLNTPGQPRSRVPALSLLLGLFRNDGRLDYVGEVTGSFNEESVRRILKALDSAAAAECPFDTAPAARRLVFWCEPEVVVTAGYAEWDDSDRLRFPVFESLRPDVPAHSCLFPGDI